MYDALWIFFIYAFLGWCMEVIYATTDTGKFINRGFLNGPICPIYGIGMVIVVSLLSSIQDNIFVLFIGAMILTSILEFITGFILEKIFNDKWWDYSDLPFNIKGYICLKFSLLWGIACVFIMKLIYPLVDKLIGMIPRTLGIILLCVLSVTIITDFVITLINVLNLPKRINRLVDIENKLNELSISIGNELSENTLSMQEKKTEIEKNIKEKIKKQEELKEKYKKLLLEKNFVHKRLLNAFPRIKNGKYKEIAKKILENREKRK